MSSFNDIGPEAEPDCIPDYKPTPPLTTFLHATKNDSELSLVLRYQQTTAPAHRYEHDRLGKQLADAFKSHCRNSIMLICPHPESFSTLTYDDLFNEAQFAVLQAALRYEPDKGATFRTYVTQRIKGAILDLLRERETNTFGLSRREFEIVRAWKKYTEAAPVADDTCCALNLRSEFIASVQTRYAKISKRAVENIINLAALHNVPLSSDADDKELEDVVFEGSLRDPSVRDPFDIISIREANEHAVNILNEALQSLTENERLAVLEKLFGSMTYAEQASIRGVTESRICQLAKAGAEKLHRALSKAPQTEGIFWQELQLGLSDKMQIFFTPQECLETAPPSIQMPPQLSAEQIRQLDGWHFEKTGHAVDTKTTTRVWLKLDNGSWAQGSKTWTEIIAQIQTDIAALEQRLTSLNARPHQPRIAPDTIIQPR